MIKPKLLHPPSQEQPNVMQVLHQILHPRKLRTSIINHQRHPRLQAHPLRQKLLRLLLVEAMQFCFRHLRARKVRRALPLVETRLQRDHETPRGQVLVLELFDVVVPMLHPRRNMAFLHLALVVLGLVVLVPVLVLALALGTMNRSPDRRPDMVTARQPHIPGLSDLRVIWQVSRA